MMRDKGFILIELLVVIAIIALLSGAVFASLVTSREKARMARAKEFASMLDRTLGHEAIAGWGLDEGAGLVANDTTGNGNSGQLLNGETFSTDTPSGAGKSIALNGTTQYVHVPEKPGTKLKFRGGELTIAAWIKPALTENTSGRIISKPWNGLGEYNYTLERNADGTLMFILTGATDYAVVTDVKTPVGRWSHVAASVDRDNNVAIYIDGVRVFRDVQTVSNWVPVSGDLNLPLAIGTYYPYGVWGGNMAFSFEGLIDEPRVFGAAITQK